MSNNFNGAGCALRTVDIVREYFKRTETTDRPSLGIYTFRGSDYSKLESAVLEVGRTKEDAMDLKSVLVLDAFWLVNKVTPLSKTPTFNSIDDAEDFLYAASRDIESYNDMIVLYLLATICRNKDTEALNNLLKSDAGNTKYARNLFYLITSTGHVVESERDALVDYLAVLLGGYGVAFDSKDLQILCSQILSYYNPEELPKGKLDGDQIRSQSCATISTLMQRMEVLSNTLKDVYGKIPTDKPKAEEVEKIEVYSTRGDKASPSDIALMRSAGWIKD